MADARKLSQLQDSRFNRRAVIWIGLLESPGCCSVALTKSLIAFSSLTRPLSKTCTSTASSANAGNSFGLAGSSNLGSHHNFHERSCPEFQRKSVQPYYLRPSFVRSSIAPRHGSTGFDVRPNASARLSSRPGTSVNCPIISSGLRCEASLVNRLCENCLNRSVLPSI